MATTIGIGFDKDKSCILWCNVTRRMKKTGRIYFSVINGRWDGYIEKNILTIPDLKDIDAVIIWEGIVPSPYNKNYDDAIWWINEQLGMNNKAL